VTSRVRADFGRRAARAELLIPDAPAARDPLRFAAGLYRAQADVAARLEEADVPLAGRLDGDADRILDAAAGLLRYAAESGPSELAEEARKRQADLPATAVARLLVYWQGDRREDYLSRAILRPYVEVLRAGNRAPDRIHRRGDCPFCGGGPWVSLRRDGSAFEGARRMLCCALCGVEWSFGRILCASCFEEDPHKLPAFQNDKHPLVRIETCETCRRYVKSIDLSEDARPIPEVDDLASLSMDLWAAEQGYQRIEPGLAGI
jgi:FdhE protein